MDFGKLQSNTFREICGVTDKKITVKANCLLNSEVAVIEHDPRKYTDHVRSNRKSSLDSGGFPAGALQTEPTWFISRDQVRHAHLNAEGKGKELLVKSLIHYRESESCRSNINCYTNQQEMRYNVKIC